MSKRSRQRRAKPTTGQRQRYDRETHGQGLMDFMQAWDDPDLEDGAWQAMLEEGGEAYADAFGIDIDGYDAFQEYMALSADADQ